MSLLVTGSIGIDTVETPHGRRDNVIGGSAIYFAYAASFFTRVRMVGAVGEDCPPQYFDIFKNRDVDLSGLERCAGSKTFRWHGSYLKDLNEAETVEVDLNVLAEQAPKIPKAFADSRYVFLANTHPLLQQEMLCCIDAPRLIVADTMNLWIQTERDQLLKLLKKVHGLVMNDGEARLLTEKKNLIEAARTVLDLGPQFVVIKKGEHLRDVLAARYVRASRISRRQSRRSHRRRRHVCRRDDGLPRHARLILIRDNQARPRLRHGDGQLHGLGFSLDGLKKLTRETIDERWFHYKQAMSF